MVSGVDDPELGKAAIEHGAYAYLVKPVGATQLYLMVVNTLRRRNLEREHLETVVRLESMVAERAEQMRRAAELQAGMLPASPLKEDAFELAAHFTPAREISGDFYDWYHSAPDRLNITLGDVMGKGLQASLMMATARAALRGAARIEPMDVGITQAAAVMSAALEVNHAYGTVFNCAFNLRSGQIQYVDAGHGHARVLRGSTGQEVLPERRSPIGIFPHTPFLVAK